MSFIQVDASLDAAEAMESGSLKRQQPRQQTRDLMKQPPAAGVHIERSDMALPGASLTFKDLAFSAVLPTGDTKTILEPCSGHFEPGQLVAMMGPSGCGKTTLLDMLAMKKTSPYSGQVWVNGHEREAALFPRIAAYVGQDDHMPAHWRVREALEFNAALKCRDKRAAGFVDTLLEAFGLAGVADTYIGGDSVRGISGGQRRRVTLARGVAAQASLLFCDEPTSGLSATDAELCVKALRVIAKRLNVLVFVVIHQPRMEVANVFDTLVLLTSNPGRMAFCGPMAEAPAYFAECGYPVPTHANPTDFFLDLLTPGTEQDATLALMEAFTAEQRPLIETSVQMGLQQAGLTAEEMLRTAHGQVSLASEQGAAPRVRLGPYAAPFHEQLRVLLRRKLLTTLRNPGAGAAQVFMPIVMGIVLGSIFKGIGTQAFGLPQISFVFILLTMLSLQGLPLMSLLIEERGFMKHEASERLYTETAHILTSLCVTVPLSMIGAIGKILVIFAFSGLSFKFLPTVLGWTLLLYCFFDGVFSAVAAAAPDGQQAQTMATPFLVVFMLFNGSIVTRATAPVYLRWIFEISPTNYALQAIVLPMADDAGESGQLYVDMMGYKAGENTKGILLILVMTVAVRLLQVAALKYLNRPQK